MRNRGDLTNQQLFEDLFGAMYRLGFDPETWMEFLKKCNKARKERVELLNSLEGGWKDDRGGWVVTGEKISGIPVVSWRENRTGNVRAHNVTFTIMTNIFIELHSEAYSTLPSSPRIVFHLNPGVHHLKQFRKDRDKIRLAVIYLSTPGGLKGTKPDAEDIKFFVHVLVPYWRKALETFRVQLRLDGQPDYTNKIQQIDLFLKILEVDADIEQQQKEKSKT